MALTVINNPIGHKLTGIEISANIYDDGTGRAIVYTGSSHGLSDGDYVYIQSDFDAYNGFKYVDSTAYDYFLIKESENGAYTEYVQDAEIEYQVSILDHGFLAVHQPIVYEIESDLYPNNLSEESYQPNTVDSQADADGYTQINLDQALSDPTELAKIELVGDGELAGVYQIITVLQPWSVVIDLAYDATNDFTGYLVVKYYDNYAINVNVYAGLTEDHPWEDRKPFELAATLKFVPDSEGRTKFSIADLLRGYINNRNNLTLDTLPNNLDFVVGFYIEFYESYDESDGETIYTVDGVMNLNPFVGYALNAKLEFKTESISHLSEYINEDVYLSQWLTIFERPVLMLGKFFDISFINQYNDREIIILKGGVEYLTIPDPGIGIIRVPIEAESGEEEICIEAWAGPTTEMLPASEFDLSTFLNDASSSSDWVLGSNPSFPNGDVGVIYKAFVVATAQVFLIHYEFVITTEDGSGFIRFGLGDTNDGDAAPGVADYVEVPFSIVGVYSGTVSITTTNNREYFWIAVNAVFVDPQGFISSIGYGDEEEVEVPGFQITEEICIEVIEECESTYIPEDARLLEDGGYRLLE